MKQGWEIKKLGDVCDFQGGSQPPKSQFVYEPKEGYVRFLQIRDFASEKNITYIPESKKNRHCNEDDILLGRYGASVGKVLINKSGAYNVAVMKTIPNETILFKRYLFFYLNTNDFQTKLLNTASRSAQDGFSKDDIFDFPILIPPLPEQQRIVSILDEAFAAIAKAKANAEQNLQNAKELFESYLQGVFENGNWETKTLKELTTKIGSGATPRGGQESYKSEGISLVRSMNVHDWEFKERNLAFIDEKQAKELDGVTLQEQDVLLNITGASVARCCVFPKEYLPARVNQHVSIIRPKKELLDARFLNLLLTSKPYKDQLLFTGEQGATRQAITKAQIESFRISIPSLKEQQTIVRQLNALRAKTQKLEAVYHKKLEELEELKKSVLQKAFNGEL
ncbi:MAG: restriction endonuclease subunit S [Paludibacter sp.]|nr:restriction endonuclease subunit S [Paludibacter sp.]